MKKRLHRWGILVAVILAAAGVYHLWPVDIGDPPVRRVLVRPEVRIPVTTPGLPAENSARLPVHSERIFPQLDAEGLTLVQPVPGDPGQLVALEKKGRLVLFSRSDEGAGKRILLDLSSRIDPTQNGGLLGLAFDPRFAENRRFYLFHTTIDPNRIVVARYGFVADRLEIDPAATKVLLENPLPKFSHVGGTVAFGPDGMLYISTGYGDVLTESQDLQSLLGKILRIDPSRGTPYAVPGDNPFAGREGEARPEIWAYGLRNPWRFSFDPRSGDIWLGDIGTKKFEEVNLVTRGGNYGWHAFEANEFRKKSVKHPPADAVPPVLEIPHTVGQSVIGGYVYRGSAMPSLAGHYIYGDYATGAVWALDYADGKVRSNREIGFVSGLTSFFEDHDGELCATALGGEVYRFREPPPGTGAPLPAALSATGVFKDTAAMVPADGMVEYEVASVLWSNGATKRRWLGLPGNKTIDFKETEPWEFPKGTVVVKHFDMQLAPGEWRRVETRLMVHEESGWGFYTYKWNDEQTDAILVTEPGQFELVSTQSPRHNTDYFIPSTTECMVCHTPAAGIVLGLQTNQINTLVTFADGPANQLDEWNRLGMFARDIGPASSHVSMVDPWDTTRPLHDRVRSYLEANCASCHQPGGPTRSIADMRHETPLAEAGLVDAPTFSGSGKIVVPGDPGESQLYRRLVTKKGRPMPPVGLLHSDPFAKDLVRRWIRSGAKDSPPGG